VTRHEVIVVGAGPAGLSAAATLGRAGLDPLVIDRASELGSAWRTRYDSFRLHTIRWLSGLPGMRIPPRYGSWVARDDFVDYLRRYAQRFAVEPRLGVELTGLEHSDAGEWALRTSIGQFETPRVVLATGACAEPRIPDWPGRPGFARPLIHSSQYRSPQPYAGQRVLVVGSGNSAAEIATDLAAHPGVVVEMAVRTPPTILRRDNHGLPTQPVGIAIRHLPPAVVNPLGAALGRLTVPNLAEFGLPAPKAPFSQFARTGTVPVLDHGFVAAVRAGRIAIRPGVADLDGDDVAHSDGSRSRPDAVIAATGYTAGLQPILGHLNVLDARGLPTVGSTGGVGATSGLHTVGITVLLSGLLREIGLDARRLARAVR
jgi:cation diffusion facilitator CzcD-associated flavoprotein CzcO